MTFQSYVLEKKPLLVNSIISFLEQKKKDTDDYFLKDAIEKLKIFSVKGKMLRGIFILLAYEMFGSKAGKNIYNAAAAIEILHAGLLIHDDIMDNDTIRRGDKTIFAQYGANLYGQSMGICIGDYAFFLAMELLDAPEIINLFIKEAQQIQLAQMKDVTFAYKNDQPSEKEIRDVYQLKTARYSFSLPFLLGAQLAKVSKEKQTILDSFGEQLGIAFQIQDDMLGIYGDEQKIGKSIGSDIQENKKTLLRCYLYQKVSKEERNFLNEIFGNKNISKGDLKKLKLLLEKYAVKEKLEKEKLQLITKGLQVLDKLSIDKQYKKILTEIAQQQMDRIR